MDVGIGPRRQRLLAAWREVTGTHPTGPGYELTLPSRSDRFRDRLAAFVADPTDETFEALWQPGALAVSTEWVPDAVQNLWPYSLAAFAEFLDEIKQADTYNSAWETRLGWGTDIVHEVYSRSHPDEPIVSGQARRGLAKFGLDADAEYSACRERLLHFRDSYEQHAGHVTADAPDTLPVWEEIDQLFRLVTTVDEETIRSEADGPRSELYAALHGYPASAASDRGPIDIDFDAATPAIDGHIAARASDAYKDLETTHWAGGHYEWWKWDFAEYVTTDVMAEYDLTNLAPDELEGFMDAFWANADEYTDTDILSTPVPQYLLGTWGVKQFADFKAHCLAHPERTARVFSDLFDEDQHLVDRLNQFHALGEDADISDGNLLRVATTFLMGAYPDEYVNFQYERFDTFFGDCSSLDSLNTGFDARQYYRIILACRDIRDVLREELPDANMLDVHTLIRLYQDF